MIKRNPIIKRNHELWKSIKDFPEYQISNMGRIKSLTRTIPHKRTGITTVNGRILKQDNWGPYCLGSLSQKGKLYKFLVHLLVIQHFGDPKPSSKYQCNHADGDKSNNWDNNLEWMTPKENTQHSYDMGLNKGRKGEESPIAKLTDQKVKDIRSRYSNGEFTQKELAKFFKVCQSVIHDIVTYKSWKHI